MACRRHPCVAQCKASWERQLKTMSAAIERLNFELYQWLFAPMRFDLATGSFVLASLFFGAGIALVLALWKAHQ